MDRNPPCQWRGGHRQPVALRKESVDRNVASGSVPSANGGSLSARRAWIEIEKAAKQKAFAKRSLSARRAWIEIVPHRGARSLPGVALRKESVDRNRAAAQHNQCGQRRSPQGERG